MPEEIQIKEIDFLEFVRVIIKEKRIIIFLSLIGLILGFVWYFLGPLEYRGKTILEIGTFIKDVRGEETRVLIESPTQVAEKIKNGTYGGFSGATAVNLKETNLVAVELLGDDFDEVKKKLETINESMVQNHKEKFKEEQDRIDETIATLEKETENLKKDTFSFLIKGREAEVLQLEVRRIEEAIDYAKSQKEELTPTKVINQPLVTEKKPSYLSPVMGWLLGFFVGLVFAFVKDWWRKNRGWILA